MPTTTNSLDWKTNGPFQIATDGGRLHVREALDSVIGGTLLVVGLMAAAGYGGFRLVQAEGTGYRVTGGVLLAIAAVLLIVLLRDLSGALGFTASTRRPLLTLDRGNGPGDGSIHVGGRRVGISSVRCFTTRPIESGRRGEILRRTPVAELHDGTDVLLTLSANPDWADFYGRQCAAWMGLPYERASR